MSWPMEDGRAGSGASAQPVNGGAAAREQLCRVAPGRSINLCRAALPRRISDRHTESVGRRIEDACLGPSYGSSRRGGKLKRMGAAGLGIAAGYPGEPGGKGGDPLKLDITLTFLELGDATSRNLEFSHCDDVWVSYGEETITETNLLEISRRHPGVVHVRTFPKPRRGAETAPIGNGTSSAEGGRSRCGCRQSGFSATAC